MFADLNSTRTFLIYFVKLFHNFILSFKADREIMKVG